MVWEQLMNKEIDVNILKKVPLFLPLFQLRNMRYVKSTEPMQ